MVKKVGIITAGGDCPGLNAVIRGIVKTAEYANVETFGFLEGYKGLLENRYIKLDALTVSDIIETCKMYDTLLGKGKANMENRRKMTDAFEINREMMDN